MDRPRPRARAARLMAVHRFYAPDASSAGMTVMLPSGEAHQLRRVLRLCAGATVHVFDGHGREFVGRVDSVGRACVTVRTLEAREPAREPAVRLTLAVAVLKGRGVDSVIRDATMLGAAAIRPLSTDRSRLVASAHADSTVSRWQAIAVSSVKQCRRAVVPLVHDIVSLQQLVSESSSDLNLLLVEPALGVLHESIGALAERSAPASATIVVGPEGGWTEDEVTTAAAAGFVLLMLGSRTLRADAAPAAAISVLQYVWGDL